MCSGCIDAYVLCTHCQACHTAHQSLSSKPEEYAAWVIQHLDECDKHFNGKSNFQLFYMGVEAEHCASIVVSTASSHSPGIVLVF